MSLFKLCPFCAEDINATAVKCNHCGSMLTDSMSQLKQSAPRPEPEYTYSIVLDNIENKEAKHNFAKRVNNYLKIPFPQMSKLLVPGQVLKYGMEQAEANNLLELLSSPGIKLSVTRQDDSDNLKAAGILYSCMVTFMVLGIFVGSCSLLVGSEQIGFLELIAGLVIFLSSIWVAHEIEDVFGMGNETASRWALGVLLLWPFVFPYYLIKRKDFLQNK